MPRRPPGELQRQLGASLRAERDRMKLSQEQFADVLHVHRTYVGALERGERNPSLLVVEALAKRLGLRAIDLLDGPISRPLPSGAPALRAARSGAEPPDARTIPKKRRS